MKVVKTATMLFIADRCRHKKSASMDRAEKSPIGRLGIGMNCTVVMIPGFLLCHAVSVAVQLAPGHSVPCRCFIQHYARHKAPAWPLSALIEHGSAVVPIQPRLSHPHD